MLQELCSSLIDEAVGRLVELHTVVPRWLDEVTRPPREMRLDAEGIYSGVVFISRNQVRRGVLFEHRGSYYGPGEDLGHPNYEEVVVTPGDSGR